MKCPSCKAHISYRYRVPGSDGKNVYRCSRCEKLLVRAHSLPFFLVIFAVFVPIADGILTGVVEGLFHAALGEVELFGVEVTRLISMAASICLFVGVFVFLNTLKPVKEDLENGAIDDTEGTNSKDR